LPEATKAAPRVILQPRQTNRKTLILWVFVKKSIEIEQSPKNYILAVPKGNRCKIQREASVQSVI
jgi:hypothetical protein